MKSGEDLENELRDGIGPLNKTHSQMGQTTSNGESLKYERPGPKGGKVPRPETMSPLSPETPPEYDRKNSHGSTGMFNRSSNLKENRKKDRDRLMS